MLTLAQKRRAQNREAQRGFRARQAEFVRNLEQTVEEISTERNNLKEEFESLKIRYNELRDGLKKLVN